MKWDCPLERTLGTATPVIVKICDVYLSAARKRSLGRVDDGMVRNLIAACQNDLLLTFNPKVTEDLSAKINDVGKIALEYSSWLEHWLAK